VPVAALAQGKSLRLYPDDGCKTARFEKYREAWDLFRGDEARANEERITVVESGSSAIEGDGDPGDESLPLCFARRAPIWKPRFFGR